MAEDARLVIDIVGGEGGDEDTVIEDLPPSKPRPAPVGPPPPSRDLIDAILKYPGAKQFGFTSEILGKMGTKALFDIADQLGIGNRTAASELQELKSLNEKLQPKPPSPQPPPQSGSDQPGRPLPPAPPPVGDQKPQMSEFDKAYWKWFFGHDAPFPKPSTPAGPPPKGMPPKPAGLDATPPSPPAPTPVDDKNRPKPSAFDKAYADLLFEDDGPTGRPASPAPPPPKGMPPKPAGLNATPPSPPPPPPPRPQPPGPPPPGAQPGWSGRPIAPVAPPRPVAYPAGTQALQNLIPRPIASAASSMGFNTTSAAASAARAIGPTAAAAAGPAAAIFLVAELASRKIADDFNKAAESARRAGQFMEKLAANDHLGMFDQAVDQATQSLEEIPVVGRVWAAEIRAAVAPVRAMAGAASAFVQRGRELSAYSGPLASSVAKADARSYLGDVREADRTGAAMARLIDAESRANDTVRQILLPIKDLLTKSLAGLVETGANILEAVKKVTDTIYQALDRILEGMKAVTPFERMKDAIGEIQQSLRPVDESKETPIMDWLNAADQLGRNQPVMAPNKEPVLGPVFGA